MNYVALRRKEASGLHLWMRPEAKAAELTELAQPGDTMHKIPQGVAEADVPNCNMLLGFCEDQVANGDCFKV